MRADVPLKNIRAQVPTFRDFEASLDPAARAVCDKISEENVKNASWGGSRKMGLWDAYDRVVGQLIREALQCEDPHISLQPFDSAQSAGQRLAYFVCYDRATPKSDRINWHGQTLSQVSYNGAILVDDTSVSIHT